MSSLRHRGGCLCGQFRFEVQGAALSCCYCHCRSCRAAFGAPVVPWATFARSQFSVLAGELTHYVSSPQARRGFCAHCGTSVSYARTDTPTELDLAVAVFDQPEEFVPDRHIWVSQRVAWLDIGDQLPQFPEWTVTDTAPDDQA